MGFKIAQFKYFIVPIFPISVAKIILFFYVTQEITQIVLDYRNYLHFNDQSLQQLTEKECDEMETIFNRYFNIVYQIKDQAEYTAIQNENQIQQQSGSGSNSIILENYAYNIKEVDGSNIENINGYDKNTEQSTKCYLWYYNNEITKIDDLNTDQKKQVRINYLRLFQVIRPIYLAQKSFIKEIIIFSEKTNIYMRYPARKNNAFSSDIQSKYDFKKTFYYQYLYGNYKNNKKDPTFVQFSGSQEAQYLCVVIEINVKCQNDFCGGACIILKDTFNEFSNWVQSSQKFYQNLDKIYLLLRQNQIIFTSQAKQGSTSSKLLPLSNTIKNIAMNYNRGTLLIQQTNDAWISCNSIEFAYSSSQLGYLSQCSISSKIQLKAQLNQINKYSFTTIYTYPIFIYLFMILCAILIINNTAEKILVPITDIIYKMDQISNGDLHLNLPSKVSHQVQEIKDLYEALSILYDCLKFSNDEYYENEEDSQTLIRLCRALKHFKKINYHRGIGIVNNNIGLIHIQNSRYEDAIKSFKHSLKTVEDRMRSLIDDEYLEWFYNVKPEKGWKQFVYQKIQDEQEDEQKELKLDIEQIPEKNMKSGTVENLFSFLVARDNKDQIKVYKRNGIDYQSAYRFHANQNSSTHLKYDKYKTIGKNTPRRSLADIFNGIPITNPFSTPKNNQFVQFSSRAQNIQDKSQFFNKQTVKQNSNKKVFKKQTIRQLQKCEPLFIDRCYQLANAYYIYAFDIKKKNPDRKESKKFVDKAIEKYKMVSRLLKSYEHIPSYLKKHFMVIIRLMSLYLECADYNKFFVQTEDKGYKDFDKSFEAYENALAVLKKYDDQKLEKENDILQQINFFYIFLYLKEAGIYIEAYKIFQDQIEKYKFYDPAIRYSYLTHVKIIIEKFCDKNKVPKNLNDLINRFQVRKNKDIVFVLNFAKPLDENLLKRKKKKLTFENPREKISHVFMKIYEKYIEGDDRIAYIQFKREIDVIFELKYKNNNEKYFKKCILQNTKIDDSKHQKEKDKKESICYTDYPMRETIKPTEQQVLNRESAKIEGTDLPTFKKLCRSIYTAYKLFDKVERKKNLKWIVVLTDNLDNNVESPEQKKKCCKQLEAYLEQYAKQKRDDNAEQPDLTHLMIIGDYL